MNQACPPQSAHRNGIVAIDLANDEVTGRQLARRMPARKVRFPSRTTERRSLLIRAHAFPSTLSSSSPSSHAPLLESPFITSPAFAGNTYWSPTVTSPSPISAMQTMTRQTSARSSPSTLPPASSIPSLPQKWHNRQISMLNPRLPSLFPLLFEGRLVRRRGMS